MKSKKELLNKGFSLVELIIAFAIMAVLISIIAPVLLSNVENSRKSKDLYNAKTMINVFKVAYANGEIKFNEGNGQSAVWVFVTREKAYFYANGAAKFPTIKGVNDATVGAAFKELMDDYGVDGDSLVVNDYDVTDTGAAGTDEGWNWYCVYLLSDGKVGAVSGPGNAPEDYLASWGNFRGRILNWADRGKSAMARQIAY